VFVTLGTNSTSLAHRRRISASCCTRTRRDRSFSKVAGGTAYVRYPEATEECCTAALLLEVDPIGLVRSGKGKATEGFTPGQYVNDRPYAASSLLAVALGKLSVRR
jgi:hypothetical protein